MSSFLEGDFPDQVDEAAQASRRRLVTMTVEYWNATVEPLLGPIGVDEKLMMRSSYVRKVLNSADAVTWIQEQ